MSFLSKILKLPFLRKSIITHLKSSYFNEFNLSIPVSNGYSANLSENDSYDSFSEIFIQGEYEQYLPKIDIRKVIDIGANYGYFSLWLQSKQPNVPIECLFIEASSRCYKSLKSLTSEPTLSKNFSFLNKAIGNPVIENLLFYDRPFMAGSVFEDSDCHSKKNIPVVSCDEIRATLCPPYDVIKCDIEGAEWEFLSHYQSIIKESHFFILEWHSWHTGKGGQKQIIEKVRSLNFEILKMSEAKPSIGKEGEVGLILAKNLNFQF